VSDENERDEFVMTQVAAALEQPRSSREDYLRSVCPDRLLREEISERVDWEERMGEFLREPLPTAFDLTGDPFIPGDLVAGRFRIFREVGRGGMGVVYEAFDRELNRRIAIKAAHPGFHDRLPPEARAAGAISHFNVCKVYDLHFTDSASGVVKFLSMELIDGETMRDRIRRAGPLPDAEAMMIASQVCAGLAQAHRQDVIHGDLKPGNIILSPISGGVVRAVITDFGLATSKTPGGPFMTGLQGGSLDYMAPELFAGERPSVASDIYALGVLLHFMLTGQTPTAPEPEPAALPDGSTKTLYLDLRAAPPERRCQPLPPRWAGVVARCLRNSPEHRFRSAEEVARRLQAPITRRGWLAAAAGLAAALAGVGWLSRHSQPGTSARSGPSFGSIAVLPFISAGGGPQIQYICDGISEDLINALAQLPNLKVIARTSSFKFRGESVDLRRAAKILGVGALVTGWIAETEGRLRISVEVVDGTDGTRLWGSQYSPRLADLPATQSEIARQIGEQVRAELTSTDRMRLARAKNINPEAYGLFLRGRYELRLYTPESRNKAVAYFEQALAIDPAFALANAELAAAYRSLSASAIRSTAEMLPKAEAAANRALAADPQLAEAHFVLAGIRRDQWDWAAAGQQYRRALELAPNLAAARQGYAVFLTITGSHDEAVREILRARERDPISVSGAVNLGAVYYNARRFDEASAALRRAIELDPSAPSLWMWTGMVDGARGQFNNAITAFEKAMALGDNTAAIRCFYVYSLARGGRRPDALRVLAELEQSGRFVPAPALAIAYAGLGDRERALQLLESGVRSKDSMLQYVNVEAHFDVLRRERRFHDLVSGIGLSRVSGPF
jgi:eukaryotic-like serine/threonine-protein kinase